MAWDLTISGVSKKSYVRQPDGVTWNYQLNNRGAAKFRLLAGYVPNQFDPVIIYAQDGSTPLWGGIVLKRTQAGIVPGSVGKWTAIDCADWSAYGDYCYATKDYTVGRPVTPILTTLAGSPTTILCYGNHGLTNGDRVSIAGSTGTTPTINGYWIVTVTSPSQFTIPVSTTGTGVGGTVVKVVALETVIGDLVTDHLGAYSITYTPVTYGVYLNPFAWKNVRVSDAFRELTTKTQYAFSWSPSKVLTAAIPGYTSGGSANPAPYSLIDAAPNCREVTWNDSDVVPYNKVLLDCGTGTNAGAQNLWVADGATTNYYTDWPMAAPAPSLVYVAIPGYLGGAESSYFLGIGSSAFNLFPGSQWSPIDTNGNAHMGAVVYTDPTALNALIGHTLLPSGSTVRLPYTSQYPGTVMAYSGATPSIEYLASDDSVLTLPDGYSEATALLATVNQQVKDVNILTLLHGWQVGQALTIALTARITGVPLINQVNAHLISDTYWEYNLVASLGVYQGTYLDRLRSVLGGSSSGTAVSVAGGGGTTGSNPSYYLGGSQVESYRSTGSEQVASYVQVTALTSGPVTVYARLKCRDAGIAITPVLYDVTAAADVVPGGAATTSTSWTTVVWAVTLIAGHIYEMRFTATAGHDCWVIGRMQ